MNLQNQYVLLRSRTFGSRGGIATRLAAAVAITGILVASGAFYMANMVLTPEWVRGNIVPLLEHEIGRKIFFQDFRLSWRGFILKRVSLTEDPAFFDSGGPFAAVDRILVGFDPLGLFAGMLLIDYVRLEDPAVNLIRRPDGRWNVSTLFTHPTPEFRAAPEGEPQHAIVTGAPKESRIHIVLTSVEIVGGQFRFTNLGARTDDVTVRAEAINSSVVMRDHGKTVEYLVEAAVSAPTIKPTPVSLTGIFQWKTATLSMHNRFGDIDVDAVTKLIQSLRTTDDVDVDLDSHVGRLAKAKFTIDSHFTIEGLSYRGVHADNVRFALRRSEHRYEIERLDATIGKAKIVANGTADFAGTVPTYTGKIQVEQLDAKDAVKLAELKAPLSDASGTLTAVVDFATQGSNGREVFESALGLGGNPIQGAHVHARVAIDLDRVDLTNLPQGDDSGADTQAASDPFLDTGTLEIEADVAIGKVVVGERTFGSFKTRGALKNGMLIVDRADADFAKGHLNVRGHVNLVEAIPSFEGNLTLNSLDYQKLLGTVPAKPWIDTDGEITASIDFKGRDFRPSKAWQSMTGAGTADNAEGYLRGHATIHMDALDLDRINDELTEEERERRELEDPMGLGPIATGSMSLDADLTVDKIRLWKLDYTNAVGKVSLNNEKLRIDEITGTLAGGDIELAGNVDISVDGLSYDGRASLEGAQVQPFINAYASADFGEIGGIGNATAEFRSRGTHKKPALESLAVDGYIAIEHAEVTESEIFKRIAKATGVKHFKKLKMSECGGDITVANQVVSTKHLVLGGEDARLLIVGSVTFQQELDAEVWLGFDQEVERQLFSTGILLPYVNDGSGWTYIPLKYSGTYSDPKVTIPTKAYSSTVLKAPFAATERIVRTGSRLIPGGEKVVGLGIDTVRTILRGVGKILTFSSQKAKVGAIGDSEAEPKLTIEAVPNADQHLRVVFPTEKKSESVEIEIEKDEVVSAKTPQDDVVQDEAADDKTARDEAAKSEPATESPTNGEAPDDETPEVVPESEVVPDASPNTNPGAEDTPQPSASQ